MLNLNLFHDRTQKIVDITRLKNSKTAIIGCGGIGSFAAEFLARSGVGHLVLIDFDAVELSNLTRQDFTIKDIKKPKVEALKERILKVIPSVNLTVFNKKFNASNADELLKDVDIVLSAVDSFAAKKEINLVCKKKGRCFVHASAFKQNGEILFVTRNSACVECLYPDIDDSPENPETVGVIPMVPTIVGLIASNMMLNYLSNRKTYENTLYRFDFKSMNFYKLKINPRKNCKICSKLG